MDIPIRFDDDGVEEGEIGPLMDDYDPALEFPGDDEVSQYLPKTRISSPSPPAVPAVNKTTTCRLIVLASSILPPSKRIAVLDGQAEVSIGRDVVPSARIRLKEMAVSKFHASIYWDGSRREWGIVDRGSMHGTFVRSARDPSTSASGHESPGTRLSQPRQSSMPRVLRHLDQVTIGGTTFLVHEHLNARPCSECAIDGKPEIPLFSSRAPTTVHNPVDDNQRKRKLAHAEEERDPKRAMAKLKGSLMSRHQSHDLKSSAAYKDRSALRRQLHPEPRMPIPPSPAAPPDIKFEAAPVRVPVESLLPPRPPSPPPPVSSSNIGHKLLLLQGWSPGTALGEDPSSGLVEPLNLAQNAPRAGLGSVSATPSSYINVDNWKEEARRRRWDDARGN
ncbi:hypothetical protein BU17DRAFT_78429 [Hysterangium stoloniferum]|nr:hypothetical protein BU17DRAFT_78429 [Hysterangium stoloniferum]